MAIRFLPVSMSFLALAAVISAGCGVSAKSVPVGSVKYQPNDRRLIAIYPQAPQRPHTVVAKIAVSGKGVVSADGVEDELLREASRYGADAVIIDERAEETTFKGVHARAIRWTGPDPTALITW